MNCHFALTTLETGGVDQMKARIDAIIQREQAEYLENLHPANTGLFAEMEAYAAEHRVPIADREVALFLEITARAIEARRVLEGGMAIGYSVIHLARGMAEDGLDRKSTRLNSSHT